MGNCEIRSFDMTGDGRYVRSALDTDLMSVEIVGVVVGGCGCERPHVSQNRSCWCRCWYGCVELAGRTVGVFVGVSVSVQLSR